MWICYKQVEVGEYVGVWIAVTDPWQHIRLQRMLLVNGCVAVVFLYAESDLIIDISVTFC